MKIAVLSFKPVIDYYTATLVMRGHQVLEPGGSDDLHVNTLKLCLECDGCLLLGNDPYLLEIAHHFEAAGKPVWHDLTDIPKAASK